MNKDAAERKGKRSEVNSVYHYLAMCALFHLMHSYQQLHHRSSGMNKYLDFFSVDLMLPPKKELVNNFCHTQQILSISSLNVTSDHIYCEI